MENPFYITGIIPEPYFCDRGKETMWFVSTLENKAHILLTSPRRMGKTQLIRHVYEQPSIKNNCYTFYTDIYPTTSLHELVLLPFYLCRQQPSYPGKHVQLSCQTFL